METFDATWVNAQVAQAIQSWRICGVKSSRPARHYSPGEQHAHERAYDEALCEVETALKRVSRTSRGRAALREQIVTAFAKFSARALNLNQQSIALLTQDFLPVGTQLAQFARRHHPDLNMAAIIQAARNAWTASGLQPLLGARVKLTPSILGYSLLYPHTDNYLDDSAISVAAKLEFSCRFRSRLAGESLPPQNDRERAIWSLVALVERQYSRTSFPQVFESLLAIHQAQEHSIAQLNGQHQVGDGNLLRLSFAKGGTSVLADACLAQGSLNTMESSFAFAWGVLLQLGDDLQDLHEDMQRGSSTLFSVTAGRTPLDALAVQLLNFSDWVGTQMDALPHGTASLRSLLKMSWQSLITRAIADSHKFFSNSFLCEAERQSPFRFAFLRARKDRLASRQGLYKALFDALLNTPLSEPEPANALAKPARAVSCC